MKRISRKTVVRAFLVTALILGVSATSSPAHAQESIAPDVFGQPNAWDRARDPRAARDFATHVVVRHMLAQAAVNDGDLGMLDPHANTIREAMYSRAYLALDEAFRSGSTDVRLRYDLGDVLSRQQRWDAAAEVLGKVLHDAPRADEAHQAWLTLAFADAHRDKPEEERVAYEKFLEDETTTLERVVPVLNLAEADMRTHRLSDAIAGYREALQLSGRISQQTQTGVLAVWGLAIALDRAGDARSAAEQARIASRMDPEDRNMKRRPVLGDTANVFFVPSYELYWYLALGSTEDAKQAPNATAAKYYWGRAVTLWRAYLAPAEAIDKPEEWNAIAKKHLASAEKQLKAATERAKKEKPPPEEPHGLVF
ncbi:MAG: hypothetical protein ACRELY_30790 [Polyangiaceae bacterium]